jgi:hypothetical protein
MEQLPSLYRTIAYKSKASSVISAVLFTRPLVRRPMHPLLPTNSP